MSILYLEKHGHFVSHKVLPVLHPGDIVAGDNVNYHLKGESGEMCFEMIRRVSAFYVHIPTYSPELNPSEKVFGFLKEQLHHCSIYDDLVHVVTQILAKVTYDHILGWYKKCN